MSLPSDWQFSGKLPAASRKSDKYVSTLAKPVYRFGDFQLEPSERRLSAAGKSIVLTPKVFDTLVLLVERAGHVVSKDELMKALWPRGYVDESNLTKHIWVIRRALGDGEHDSPFVETVPKVGYRFVAPVTIAVPALSGASDSSAATISASGPEALTVAAPPQAPAPAGDPSPSPVALASRPSARTLAALTGTLALALIVLVVGWQLVKRPGRSEAAAHPGRTVALVGFSNLSRNAKDAWLAPALNEMLGAELSVADDVQVVPDELVRDASTDLSAPAAGGYSTSTLARLHQRLGADYVVSGSYLVSGAAADAPLRVDIALQDTRTGALRASVSTESSLSGVIDLAKRAGGRLRNNLGVRAADSEALGFVANAQPPSVDVARRIGFALGALQHFDAARARDELIEAVAEAPGYAPAYTYLAQAWSALGYRDKALAAAGQAAEYSDNLPPEQRLQAEAVVAGLRGEWDRAAAAWQGLARLKPLSLEYRLQCIDAQIAAGAVGPAQESVRGLQRLPNAASDPRVELAAARVAAAQDDQRGNAVHSANALRLAQTHDAPGLVADAQVQLARAQKLLGSGEDAHTSLLAAIAAYRATRNPRGEANARRDLAEDLADLERGQEAREEYQRSMALYQSIGDLGGVASVYRNLCSVLWVAGDRDGAQAAARRGLALARETGDLNLQAWTLRALATIASDEAASDEVLSDYREVIALNERAGNRGGHSWSLASYADIERMRGALDEARTTCARAMDEAAGLSDPQFAVYSGFSCALIDMDRGNETAARAEFEEVERRVGSGGDMTYTNDALIKLARLDMDEGRWKVARERLRTASSGMARAEERTGEAEAQALLALCDQAIGNSAERDQAAGRARQLRQSITSLQEVYVVDIALARLGGETGRDVAAIDKLLALATDAERRRWVGWSLEAKLAAWELLRRKDAGSAAPLRQDIERTAQQHGFGRILNVLAREERGAERA